MITNGDGRLGKMPADGVQRAAAGRTGPSSDEMWYCSGIPEILDPY